MSLTARRIITLPSLNSVGVSQVATSALPVGARKYHGLFYMYKIGADAQAVIEAAITTVRLLIGGKEQWNISLARLNILNALDGYAMAAGLIFIPLSRWRARTPAGEEAFGLGTANISSLQVEFTIAAGAVAPALTGWAEIEDTIENVGVVRKLKTFSGKTAGGAGVFEIADLPKRDAYNRLHLMTVQATSVQVLADGVEFFNLPRAVATALYLKQGIIQQANVYSVCFDATQQVTDLLPMTRNVPGIGAVPVQDFRVLVTMGAGATFDVIAEQVGAPD